MSEQNYWSEQRFTRYDVHLNNGDVIKCELIEAETPEKFASSRWQSMASVCWSWGHVYSEDGALVSSYKVAIPFHAVSCIRPIK